MKGGQSLNRRLLECETFPPYFESRLTFGYSQYSILFVFQKYLLERLVVFIVLR